MIRMPNSSLWTGILVLLGLPALAQKQMAPSRCFFSVLDVNCRFKRFDVALVYRYPRRNPDSNLFSELDFNGSFAGARLFF